MIRSQATAARAEGADELALARAVEAVELDERNPRAWIELGLERARTGRPAAAQQAFCAAARDLPADAVVQRCRSAGPPAGARGRRGRRLLRHKSG